MHKPHAGHDRVGPPAPLTCRRAEGLILELWSAHLACRIDDPHIDFFDAGGDSIALIEIAAAAQDQGLPLRSSAAFRHLTPARVAEHLVLPRDPAACAELAAGLIELAACADPADNGRAARPAAPDRTGRPDPLFFVHSDRYLQAERAALADWGLGGAVHGLALPAGPDTVAAAADTLISEVLARQGAGPYRLAGFDLGAPIAYELARRLGLRGEEVAALVLIAPPAAGAVEQAGSQVVQLGLVAGRFALTGKESRAEIHARMREAGWLDDAARPDDLPHLLKLRSSLAPAVFGYSYPPYTGPGVLFADSPEPHPAEQTWTRAGTASVDVVRLDFRLESPLPVLRDKRLADTMRKVLDA